MKKEYIEPQMEVVNINHSQPLLVGSLKDIINNADIDLDGGSNEIGRAPLFDSMEEEINNLLGQ